MVVRWGGRPTSRRHPLPPYAAEQRASLVNVKLKWVKDRTLDSVVARERHLRPAHHLLDLISSDPRGRAPARDLSLRRRHLGLPPTAGVAAFLRRFPALFRESPSPGGPCFHPTGAALRLRRDELRTLRAAEPDLVARLRRLLMLTVDRALPLPTVNQLSWDMGLPLGYHQSLIPRYPDLFELFQPTGDERVWLRLLSWDPLLAVSELQKSYRRNGGINDDDDDKEECLAFPVSFKRGFGLKRKCLSWLQEWQTLPYTSPYAGAAGLDPRTDVSEKRIVGVFHELLHLTIGKKTERRNVSNLRQPLSLPQKFTKVFERHPGIFYLSEKLATQTVVLREAYGGGRELLDKHPLVRIRERYAAMMRTRMPERGRRDSGGEAMRNAAECGYGGITDGEEDNMSDGFDSFQESRDGSSGSDYGSCSNDDTVESPHS